MFSEFCTPSGRHLGIQNSRIWSGSYFWTLSELDAPEALENFEEFVVLDSGVPELALEMPTNAVVAIQGLAEGWLGGRGRSDDTSEAGVVALLKRVRGDLNRYTLQAADTPIDLPTVVGEVREAIVPVI